MHEVNWIYGKEKQIWIGPIMGQMPFIINDRETSNPDFSANYPIPPIEPIGDQSI